LNSVQLHDRNHSPAKVDCRKPGPDVEHNGPPPTALPQFLCCQDTRLKKRIVAQLSEQLKDSLFPANYLILPPVVRGDVVQTRELHRRHALRGKFKGRGLTGP
jgi:hypothetical protein